VNVIATAKDPSVRVRFPHQVLKRLDLEAKKNGRSRNTELIHRLSESLGMNGDASAKARQAG